MSLEAPVFPGWFPVLTVCSVNVCLWVLRLSVSRCATICSFFGISHILVKFVAISRLSGSLFGTVRTECKTSPEFGDVPEMATVSCKPCPLCQSSLPVFAVSLFRELKSLCENSATMPPVTNSQHPALFMKPRDVFWSTLCLICVQLDSMRELDEF